MVETVQSAGSTNFVARRTTEAVVPLLATLNRQLIEDEVHASGMPVSELAERLGVWLGGDYQATMFDRAAETLAYALWRDDGDAILRQFVVRREYRRLGVGRHAMALLAGTVLPESVRVRLEVLVGNDRARVLAVGRL